MLNPGDIIMFISNKREKILFIIIIIIFNSGMYILSIQKTGNVEILFEMFYNHSKMLKVNNQSYQYSVYMLIFTNI